MAQTMDKRTLEEKMFLPFQNIFAFFILLSFLVCWFLQTRKQQSEIRNCSKESWKWEQVSWDLRISSQHSVHNSSRKYQLPCAYRKASVFPLVDPYLCSP